jgi:trans-aconitate methyltransferase
MKAMLQTWDPERYQTHAGFVPELGAPLLELCDARPGERIVDLGCGDGVLTEKLVIAGAQVVGIDHAEAMVAAARARGLDAHVGDVAALDFDGAFDAVFSNAVLHWLPSSRHGAMLSGVARALLPGGRFVAEFGGHGCVAAIVTAMIAVLERRGFNGRAAMPWYFPAADEYRERLEQHGFRVETIALIPRPTPLPTDMRGWLETFARPFVVALPEVEHDAVLDEAVGLLSASLRDVRGRWTADYVRLRFLARRPV